MPRSVLSGRFRPDNTSRAQRPGSRKLLPTLGLRRSWGEGSAMFSGRNRPENRVRTTVLSGETGRSLGWAMELRPDRRVPTGGGVWGERRPASGDPRRRMPCHRPEDAPAQRGRVRNSSPTQNPLTVCQGLRTNHVRRGIWRPAAERAKDERKMPPIRSGIIARHLVISRRLSGRRDSSDAVAASRGSSFRARRGIDRCDSDLSWWVC